MRLRKAVQNVQGRTITGVEIKGSVVDHDGKAVKENTVIVIPIKQVPELEPNKTMHASVLLEGFTDSDDRANIKMEVTGFTLGECQKPDREGRVLPLAMPSLT